MKHLLITTALCLAATTAWAGGFSHDPAPTPSATTYNAASAVAGAAAHSQASAGATAQGGRATARTGPVTVNNSTGGGYGGGGYSARGNTPDVLGGSVNGGNPCGLGASGGGSGPGFGGLLSFMWEGKGCERRQNAALLANMGDVASARETLCYDDTVRRARYTTGHPCARDARGWDPK